MKIFKKSCIVLAVMAVVSLMGCDDKEDAIVGSLADVEGIWTTMSISEGVSDQYEYLAIKDTNIVAYWGGKLFRGNKAKIDGNTINVLYGHDIKILAYEKSVLTLRDENTGIVRELARVDGATTCTIVNSTDSPLIDTYIYELSDDNSALYRYNLGEIYTNGSCGPIRVLSGRIYIDAMSYKTIDGEEVPINSWTIDIPVSGGHNTIALTDDNADF